MGLGGYLMWTPVIREMRSRTDSVCFPYEQLPNGMIKPIHSDIFKNNPGVVWEHDPKKYVKWIMLQLNNPKTNYCLQDLPDRAIHRYDIHVARQICEFYGIKDADIKPELFLTAEEYQHAEELIHFFQLTDGNFVTIEPNSKMEYSCNRKYPQEKWQRVVDELAKVTTVVQVGGGAYASSEQKKAQEVATLDNVVDMRHKGTFRTTAAIIKRSRLFLSSEGGLMHAARAVNTPSIIVVSGYTHPIMTCYPENYNIWVGKDHGPCGMKAVCQKCSDGFRAHDEGEIIEEALKGLK